MNNPMSIFESLRLSQVKRWPICHMNREQSVAEHSFGVLQIAMYLADGAHADVMNMVTMHAVTHDLNEIYSGDIPSGFKRRLRAEHPAVTKMLDGPKPGPTVEAVVKLADYLEAIYYATEFGGSRFTDRVLVDIKDKFRATIEEMKTREELKASPMFQTALSRAWNMYVEIVAGTK